MNNFAPTPSSVCSSTDNLHPEVDDHSELTGLHCDDDLSHPDDVCICVQAAARHLSQTQTETQEQIDLKLRILMQQEQLDLIMSELSHFAAENEALKAERTVMIGKLGLSVPSDHQHISCGASAKWFSKIRVNNNGNNGGSMQLLVDANANLMIENSRLQVMVDIVRRSFQSYIKDSRVDRKEMDQTIKALKLENKLLRQRLNENENLKLSISTANTSLEFSEEEDLRDDSPFTPTHDKMQGNSPQSSILDQEVELGTSGSDWIVGGKAIETTIETFIRGMVTPKNTATTQVPARSKSADLLVGFEKSEEPARSGRTGGSHSIEDFARRKSDSLLVDFNQGRRAESRAKRHSSLKLDESRWAESGAKRWSSLKL